MANKVNVEINANVQGYVQGMDNASKSTEHYETDMRKVSDYVTSFNKQLAASKREVKDLSKAWAMLDKEAKNSDFGKRMKRQLEEAEKEAAKWIDMNGDIQEKLRNMASDTAVLDSLTLGVKLAGNAFSATAGTIALFTGNSKAAKDAVVAFTTAQSALTTATEIANTVQAIFNKTAKANVYVALAAAVISVTAAIYKFISAQRESTDAFKEHQKLIAQRKQDEKDMAKDIASSASQQLGAYIKLQAKWKECGNNVTKQKKFLKDYASEIKKTGFEVNSLTDAENFFVRNTNAVVQSIVARAQAQASYNMMVKEMERGLEQLNTKTVGNGGKYLHLNSTATMDNLNAEEKEWIRKQQRQGNNYLKIRDYKEYEKHGGTYETLTKEGIAAINKRRIEQAKKAGAEYRKTVWEQTMQNVKSYEEAAKVSLKALADIENKYGLHEATPGSSGGGGKTTPKKEKPDKEDPVKELNKLEQLMEDLDTAQKAFILGVDTDDKELIAKSRETYLRLKEEIEKVKLSYTIEPDIDLNKVDKETNEKIDLIMKGLNKTFSEATAGKQQSSFDIAAGMALFEDNISGLKEQMDMNDQMIESLKELALAYAALGDAGAENLQKVLEKLGETEEAQAKLAKRVKETTDKNKDFEKNQLTLEKIQTVASAAGSAFKEMGNAAEDNSLKAAGIIAEAIANIIAGYAMATTQAAKLGPWAWAAFGLTGLAQIAAVIAQIHSLSGYAEGGVIGGNSYTGDRLLARVNSGEAILNQRQQANALALMDGNAAPSKVYVEGKIRGTDILLVQKNTNKALAKAGSNITFG